MNGDSIKITGFTPHQVDYSTREIITDEQTRQILKQLSEVDWRTLPEAEWVPCEDIEGGIYCTDDAEDE